MDQTNYHKVIIVGAGFSGICSAIKLREKGVEDFVVLEKNEDVGGTWHDNNYPGAECDVESHLYSFSFEPYANWSKVYSGRNEIYSYLQNCSKKHGLYERILFNTVVESITFKDDMWFINTPQGVMSCSFLIFSYSPLHYPNLPNIEGIKDFKGTIMHTSKWNYGVELKGKNIGIIGNGASGIQCIPHLANVANQLYVFQRTPQWVLPKLNRNYTSIEKYLFRSLFLQKIYRNSIFYFREFIFSMFYKNSLLGSIAQKICQFHMWTKIKDPTVRQQLTPSYTFGCKRVLLSDDFFSVFNRSNTHLITRPIKSILPEGILMGDTKALANIKIEPIYDIDILVLATGFSTSETANKFMNGTNQNQYLGIHSDDMPNLFTILGKNSGSSHTSIILYIEAQCEHISALIKYMELHNKRTIVVKSSCANKYSQFIEEKSKHFVWDLCNNWYVDKNGKNYTLFPANFIHFHEKVSQVNLSDFIMQ
jgi:cation diffusion facilitator CzcD-associated flavoprotein CzcO